MVDDGQEFGVGARDDDDDDGECVGRVVGCSLEKHV